LCSRGGLRLGRCGSQPIGKTTDEYQALVNGMSEQTYIHVVGRLKGPAARLLRR
jgi:hypothetical protein